MAPKPEVWRKPPEDPPTLGGNLVCGSCVFFHRFADDGAAVVGDGFCRLNPPAILNSALVDEPPRGVWPIVNTQDFCGSHTTPEEFALSGDSDE